MNLDRRTTCCEEKKPRRPETPDANVTSLATLTPMMFFSCSNCNNFQQNFGPILAYLTCFALSQFLSVGWKSSIAFFSWAILSCTSCWCHRSELEHFIHPLWFDTHTLKRVAHHCCCWYSIVWSFPVLAAFPTVGLLEIFFFFPSFSFFTFHLFKRC